MNYDDEANGAPAEGEGQWEAPPPPLYQALDPPSSASFHAQ